MHCNWKDLCAFPCVLDSNSCDSGTLEKHLACICSNFLVRQKTCYGTATLHTINSTCLPPPILVPPLTLRRKSDAFGIRFLLGLFCIHLPVWGTKGLLWRSYSPLTARVLESKELYLHLLEKCRQAWPFSELVRL